MFRKKSRVKAKPIHRSSMNPKMAARIVSMKPGLFITLLIALRPRFYLGGLGTRQPDRGRAIYELLMDVLAQALMSREYRDGSVRARLSVIAMGRLVVL